MSTILQAGNATSGAVVSSDTAGSLQIQTGSTPTTAITVDTAQNVGVGVTPSAWQSVYKTIQVGTTASLYSNSSASLGNNFYVDSTGTNKYLTSSYATAYIQNSGGVHAWYNAPTGTAGNTATFTEAMRIDSSGNLLVGTASGSNKLRVAGSSVSAPLSALVPNTAGDVGTACLLVSKYDNNSTTSQVFVRFSMNNDGSSSGQINANGANASAFGSWSDSRLKENIEDLPSQLGNIAALRPVEFDYIESEGGGHQIGFVAQEMQEIYPDAVGERTDGMLTVTGWDKTTARLVKAIQELNAKVTALEEQVINLGVK